MPQGGWTIVALALATAWPHASLADGDAPAPGQATADRIMRRGTSPGATAPGAAGPGATAQGGTSQSGAASRGPGNSRDVPMPASGQDTTVMQPVDPGVADRGALTESLREMPITLRVPGAFENVYPVPGRPGLFFRAQGALYMVFDEATYRFYKGTNYVTIPPGAMFYVGRPDWRTIPSPWFRGADAAGADPQATPQDSARGAAPLEAYVDSEVDPAGQSPDRLRADHRVPVRRADIGDELGRVPGHRAGFGADSRDPEPIDPAQVALAMRTAEERERDAAAPRAPDAAALAGVLPSGVARDMLVVDRDGQVSPRIISDSAYRRERIAALMRSAAHRPRAGASTQDRQ